MGFIRYYPTKDTSISNADPAAGSIDTSDSNIGASEILNLYRTSDHAATSSILIGFDPMPTGSVAYLKMFDAQHSSTLPSGYVIKIQPLEQDWSEGTGLDADYYSDIGTANWLSATNSSSWGPTTGTLSATFDVVNGHEDLEVDITALTSSMTHGLSVKIDPAWPGDYYIKEFHSRHTHFPTKRPYIEHRFADWTGSFSMQNIYTATTGPYSGSVFSTATFTAAMLNTLVTSGTLTASAMPAVTVDPTGALVSQISDLRAVYDADEVVTLHLNTRLKDWNPATVATASVAAPSVILTSMYYRITDVVTGEVVVPFGIIPIAYTKLSYNDNGNYFKLHMGSLPEGQLLQIDFIYQTPVGDWIVLPGTANRFRVTTNG